ncbi:MAG TPA: hypothetical protein DCZ80_06740 [Legionellales bacterium]|nr:hypothetical protein [Legionellales bacterium]
MTENTSESEKKDSSIKRDEYFEYSYHRNVVLLLGKLNPPSGQAKEILDESTRIKKKIEDEVWKLKNKTPTLTVAEVPKAKETEETSLLAPTDIKINLQTSKEIINAFEIIDSWISCINMARIELGIIRNIFTFCLETAVWSEYTTDINKDSSLLASYLYPMRLINECFKVLTYAWQNSTDNIPWYDVISGYYKAHWKKFLNDAVWTLLLTFFNISIYIKDAAVQAFFQNEITCLLIGWIVVAGFLFDYYNEKSTPNKLKVDYEALVVELKPVGTAELQALEKIYEKEIKEYQKKQIEMGCYLGLFTAYAVFDLIEWAINVPPKVAVLFPLIDIVLTTCMFFVRLYFITDKLTDEEFKKKTPAEKQKIELEVYSALISEVLKIISIAIVIFVISASIPYGGLPAMLTIGAILFGLITATNLINKQLIEPYVLKPILEWRTSNTNEPSQLVSKESINDVH